MIAGTFNEWFTLQHRVRTADGQGGYTYTLATYATERGRMSHLGRGSSKSEERSIGGGLQEWTSMILYLRAGVAIERGDNVIDSAALAYEVLAVRYPSAKPVNHIEAECRLVEKGA